MYVAWNDYHPAVEWDLAEVGLHVPDLSDEMEDWDIAPFRRRYARDFDFEGDPPPMPEMRPVRARDDYADEWEESQREERKARLREDEESKRRAKVNAERRNIREMQRAAREKVLERVASGAEGNFEVHVRKGNQTLRWSYRITDGVAYIDRKVGGWVALYERRP